MGRIFEKRKDRMFARWAKNAKAFSKMGKELAIAVRLGGIDPHSNPRLRLAIQNARAFNMPKDRIDAAVQRASSKEGANLSEVTYEGYAPHGIALFIESATDNPTRTVANVRSYLSKYGGSLGTTGSLEFLFQRQGIFRVKTAGKDLDELELALIDSGLEEMVRDEDEAILHTSFASFSGMQKTLEALKLEVESASLQRIPLTTVELNPEQMSEVQKLIEILEEDDDVQHVFHNIKEE